MLGPPVRSLAQSGTGLTRSFPSTPSNEATSPGWYNRPSKLSNERFSNMRTTTWSRAALRSGGGIRLAPQDSGGQLQLVCFHHDRSAHHDSVRRASARDPAGHGVDP